MRERSFSSALICVLVLAICSGIVGQEFAVSKAVASDPTGKLTKTEVANWRADLHYIAKELPAKHANLFHRLEKARFEAAVKELNERLPNLTMHQVALEMGKIVGLARDGHSYLTTIWDPKLKFQFLPIRLYVFDDGVYVVQADSEFKEILGARLKNVEGMSVDKVIKKLGSYMSTDNEFGIAEYAPYYLVSPSILKALGISKSGDSVQYEFEIDGKSVAVNAKLDPGKDNSISALAKRAGKWMDVRDGAPSPKPLTFKHPDRSLWFEYLADKKLLFVQMNNVLDDKEKTIEQFFGEVVAFAGKNEVDKLVLDLRHNGGGNNTLVRPIIRGLIQLEEIDRKGHLFVVIGRKTFSAAQNLVNQLESWTNAAFIGEPTGSHVNMYGDARTFHLPKSGLRLRISELFWQNKHARDERKWTAPHFASEPNFGDYKNNVDPAIRAVEAYQSKPTLLELALKRQKTMDLAGFRADAIAFKNDPANKYADIESQMNRFGYNMLNIKQFDAAIALFKINVELYPESANVYDSLAEAFMRKGDMPNAMKFYNKSLELNPTNTNAVQMLERIKRGHSEKKPVDH